MWFRNIFRRKPLQTTQIATSQSLHALALSPRVFAQLDRMHIRSTRFIRGGGAGQRSSTRRRPAVDFREHRKYVAGDDIRFVDWKASARSEQVFLKQGEQPQETNVHLLIDTSRSMAWGKPPKNHSVLQLAAALGYLALSSDDRLHVVPFARARSPENSEAFVFKGKGQFPALWKRLRSFPVNGHSDLQQTVQRTSRMRRGGLVIILSDLLDIRELNQALSMLPRPAWETTIIHILHPHELEPVLYGDVQMEDVETGALENYDVNAQAIENYNQHLKSWLETIEMTCVENKAIYTLVSTGWSLETEIIPHLQRIRVLEPAR